jgi:hypothetical protein
MKNVTKVFEREDGYAEYTAVVWGKEHLIEEWNNTFTIHEWLRDNEFQTLEDAIAAIKYWEKPKGPFQIAPQIPSKKGDRQ